MNGIGATLLVASFLTACAAGMAPPDLGAPLPPPQLTAGPPHPPNRLWPEEFGHHTKDPHCVEAHWDLILSADRKSAEVAGYVEYGGPPTQKVAGLRLHIEGYDAEGKRISRQPVVPTSDILVGGEQALFHGVLELTGSESLVDIRPEFRIETFGSDRIR